jgi:polar amino acid transport system substrate-binding protein
VVYTDWFPYTFQENGRASGFEVDILKAVLATMGMEARFAAYPWMRCLDELRNGRADALVSMLKTPERETYTWFPDTCISVSRTVFFTTPERDIAFDGFYGGLSGLNIGVILGFSYGEAFDRAAFLRKDEAYTVEMLIRKLLGGRTDLAAENHAVISASARKMGVRDRIRFLEPPIHTQRLYVGFARARDRGELAKVFSEALKSFKGTEPHRAILESYGVSPADMMD